MQTFYEWLENKQIWIDLYFYLLEADDMRPNKGVYKDPNYHENLIEYLRLVGLDEDANELEMIKISQSDIDFSNSPLDSSKKDHSQKRSSSRLAYNTYMDHISHLINKVSEYINKMGWKKEIDNQYDNRTSGHPGEEDYDAYGI